MIHYEISFLIAVFALTVAYILTRPNNLLCGYYNALYEAFKTDERKRDGKGLHPLFMVLIHCEKCIAGQVALWYFVFSDLLWLFVMHGIIDAIVKGVFFVSFTIFVTSVITAIYKKYIE